MNKQARANNVGMIVVLAVSIIIGIVFMVAVADNQAVLNTLESTTNETVTFPDNGSTLTLRGQSLVGTLTAVNASDGGAVPTTNFSTSNFVQSSGGYALVLTNNDADWNGESVNLSYTYQPIGYNPDSGARGITNLILLFFSFIILSVAVIGIREWIK